MMNDLRRPQQPGRHDGLCDTCQHARIVASAKGSQFVLCERSRTDARFPKYPALPVRECAGYESQPVE
jgi:hypothetical protein